MKKMWLLALVAAFGLVSVAAAQDNKQDPPKQDPAKQDEKKPDAPAGAPFNFPLSADLKTKCGFNDDQVKKIDELYADYKTKADDAQKKVDAGEKKAKKGLASVRADLVNKLHDICTDDDQKKKLDDALPASKKKKDKA